MPKYRMQIIVDYEIQADDWNGVEDIFEEAVNLWSAWEQVEYIDHQVMSIDEVK